MSSFKYLLMVVAGIVAAVAALQAQCGSPCPFGNNDCASVPECSRCDGPGGFNGICAKGYECLHACGGSGDCDQTGNCNICINGKCVAGCERNCSTSAECGAPCTHCIAGKCEVWSCGKTCTNSSDCAGPCAQCLDGICKALCNGPCEKNGDCDAKSCPTCSRGKCVSGGQCGSVCGTDSQCTDKDCNLCISGKCAAGCGGNCTKDAQCGDKNCNRCLKGKCSPWTCGLTCDPSKGGVCAGNCGLCLANKCYASCNATCFADADCPGDPFNCAKCVSGKCSSS